MQVPRVSHAARWVPGVGLTITSGRVPVGKGSPTVVEVLDLDALTWATRNPSPLMSEVTSTALLDNRWMLLDESGAHIHDPLGDVWTAQPALTDNLRARATLSTLPGGDVLIAGGFSDFLTFHDSLRVDPTSEIVVAVAQLGHGRASHTATNLPSGAVLVAGGWAWALIDDVEVQEPIAASERYEPDLDAWIGVASMTTGRERHAAALLESGEVLVCGGLTLHYEDGFPATVATASAELYEPANDTWTPIAPMLEARYGHTITRLPSGRVIVTGGTAATGVLASAEVYDPETATWTALPSMSTPRLYAAATLVSGHGLVVSGGSSAVSIKSALATVELYPLGQVANGSPCVINDECVSGHCSNGGACAGNLGLVGGQHGSADELELSFGCAVERDTMPRGRWWWLALALAPIGWLAARRRRSAAAPIS